MTRTQLPSGPRDPGRHPGGTTALSTITRLLLTAGLVGLSVSALGAGVLATFTGSTATAAASATGAVVLAPVSVDGPGNRLSVPATDLAPGDTAQRALTLRSDGTVDLDPASARLTTTSPAPSPLVSDPVRGLQLSIDRCAVPWTESGPAPAYRYTCAGPVTVVLAPRPVLGTDVPLAGLDGTAGAVQHLRVTLTFPAATDDALQGASAGIEYSFRADQRPGAAR